MPVPRVSVLLPFRDAADTLDAALSSILESEVPLEVVAVDDGSHDEWQRCPALNDSRVRVLDGEGHGLVAALELARGEARAPFLLRMDADDMMLPGRVGPQLDALTTQPELAVVGSRARTAGGGEGLRLYVEWQNGLITPADHRRELFIESPLCHPSTMLRAEAVESIGGYRHGDFPEDYDLWLRLWRAGWDLAKVATLGVEWRHGEGRATFADPRYRPEAFLALKVPFLAHRLRDEARELVVWGAGRTGRRLMRALEPHGPRASAWVDIDPDKLGRTARGAPIRDASTLDPERHFVLGAVASRGARARIRTELQKLGFVEDRDSLFAA